MYARLRVTRHLHFWQNDRGLLRATAVTRGWNEHQTRVSTSAHKVNSGEENFPPLLSGFELATFRSRIRCVYQQTIPTASQTRALTASSCTIKGLGAHEGISSLSTLEPGAERYCGCRNEDASLLKIQICQSFLLFRLGVGHNITSRVLNFMISVLSATLISFCLF